MDNLTEIIFNDLRREYDMENKRWINLDEKSMQIATVAATIFTIFGVLLPNSFIYLKKMNCFYCISSIWVIIIILGCFFNSIVCCLYSIFSKPFSTIDPEKYYAYYSKITSLDEYYKANTEENIKSIKENRKINDEKAKLVKCSIISLGFGIFFTVLFVMILLINYNAV